MQSSAPVLSERVDYRASLSSRQKWVIFAGILVMLFLSALDGTIVATAQPAIVRQFQSIDLISWVTSGYLLSSTAMVPILGKLSDIYGRKPVMLISTVIFLLGSALSGVAPSMTLLILARILQGVGAAGILDISFAAIADLWAPGEQGKITGYVTGVFGLSSVVGPFFGGWLTDHVSWRAVFYVNVPIGIFALIFVALKMPRLGSGAKAAVDWLGVLLLLATVVPFMLALTLDRTHYPWTSPLVLTLLGTGAVALVLFLLVQVRVASPLLPLRLFRNRTFSVLVAGSALFGAAIFGSIVYLAIFLVGVGGVSATKAGAALVPMMISVSLGAGLGAGLAQKVGRFKPFMLGSMALTSISLYLMSTMSADTSTLGVTWRMVLLGLGAGPMMPLLGMAVMQTASLDEMGVTTSIRSFFQSIGQMLAVSIFGVILSTTLTGQMETRLEPIRAEMPAAFASQLETSQIKNQIGGEGGGGPADLGAAVAAQIKQGFAAERTLVTRAIRDNDPTALASIAKNPLWPEPVKQGVAQAAQLDPTAREQVLTQALAELDRAEPAAVARAEGVMAKVARAMKESFAAASTPIYLDAMFVAIACLLVLLLMPEIKLRSDQGDRG